MKIRLGEDNLIYFLAVEISLPAIKYYLIQGLPNMYIYNGIANVIISLIIICFFIPALYICIKRTPLVTFNIIAISILIYIFEFIIFKDNRSTLIEYFPKIFGMSIACLIISYNLRDFLKLENVLTRCSYFIILCGFFEFFTHTFLGVKGIEKVDYDMSFGYFLVIPTILVFRHSFQNTGKRKVLDIMVSGIGIVISMLMGSRGGIIAILLGVIFVFFHEVNVKKNSSVLVFTILLGVIFIFSLNIDDIFVWINSILQSHGINSRFISYFISGRLTWNSGRDILQEPVVELIKKNPIFGIGMLGDFRSHNIFLENILFYGIPMGICLSIIIVYEWLKIFVVKQDEKKRMMMVLFIYSFIDSLLNLTVLGKDMFWIYLGFALSDRGLFTNILKRRL